MYNITAIYQPNTETSNEVNLGAYVFAAHANATKYTLELYVKEQDITKSTLQTLAKVG